MLKPLLLSLLMGLGSCVVGGCAAAAAPKLPDTVWTQLAAGQPQDLIVELASVAHKPAALAAMPAADVELLKDYDALPMMFVRFRTPAALKAWLANPATVNVYQDQQETLMPAR
jgi:hypothetical protein